MERQITYVDATDLPIQVERIVSPNLRSHPIVIAYPISRAQVLAVSHEARIAGVVKGMPVSKAQQICHDAVIIPPKERLYYRASHEIQKLLSHFTPVLEPEKYGQVYLDITTTKRIFGGAKDTAFKVQKEIHTRLRLELSLGLASNKLVSRIAAQVTKPKGFMDVPMGNEARFIEPHSLNLLPEISKLVREQLFELNIRIIRELAVLSLEQLTILFHRLAVMLYQFAHGVDNRPVQPVLEAPSVREDEYLNEDTNDFEILLSTLFVMLERAAQRLRMMKLGAKRMRLYLRYSDYKEQERQMKLPRSSHLETELFPWAEDLLRKTMTRRTRVRLLTVQLTDLQPVARQLTLFQDGYYKQDILLHTVDTLRHKFGHDSIRFGRALRSYS